MPRKTDNLKHTERPLEIANRLKRERERLDVTHSWLEKKTGVSRFSIGRFENGKRGIDSDALLAVLFALAEVGGRLDYIILGRSSAAQIVLTPSSVDAVAERLAEKLAPPKIVKRGSRG